MKRVDCEAEAEVLAAVVEFRWPERVDARLREHVSSCAICSAVVAVAGAFDLARQDTQALAVLPDSSRVWWLAQLRARREAAEAAARPITATQVIAFAWAVGLLGVCLGAALTWFQSTTLLVEHGVLIVGTAAVVFLLPAVAYFAMGRD
jgi:hypothetical protein